MSAAKTQWLWHIVEKKGTITKFALAIITTTIALRSTAFQEEL